MVARVLKKPVPRAWVEFGEALHQDVFVGFNPETEAGLQTWMTSFVKSYFDRAFAREIRLLTSDLLEKAEATGDFQRAWKHLNAQVIPRQPKQFFEDLVATINTVHGAIE